MRKSLVHLAGNLAPAATGLLTAPLTARSLGVDPRGQLALILLVSAAVIVVGNFGLSWVARADVALHPELATAWNRLGFRVSLFLIPLAIVMSFLLASAMRLTFSELCAVIFLFGLSALSSSRGVTANVLIGLGQNGRYGLANLLMTLGLAVTIGGAFLLGVLDLTVALFANVLALTIQTASLGASLRIAQKDNPGRLGVGRRELRLSMRAVVPRALRSWLSQVSEMLVGRSDVILVGTQASTRLLGLYSVVALIPQLSYQVYATLVQQSYSRHPGLTLARRTTLLWVSCTSAGAILALVSIPSAYWLIPVIFGDGFSSSRDLIVPAAAVSFGLSGLAPVMNDVALRRKPAPYLAGAAMLILGAAVALSTLTDVALGLYGLSAMFVALGAGYVFVANRGKSEPIRMKHLISFLRTA